jgi:predicted RNA-binding protein
MPIIDFADLRSDWYSGGDFMARKLQRCLRAKDTATIFAHFPRQWIPLFVWAGAAWRTSTPPADYVPFFSAMSERDLVRETRRARQVGQLRSLVELSASCDIVLCETLQRIDALPNRRTTVVRDDAHVEGRPIVLSNWLSYTRPEFRDYEEALKQFRQGARSAIFLSCGRTRPYEVSRTHFRLRRLLEREGVKLDDHDLIVMTSIGPVPQPLWRHPVVMQYDTGIRDIYRVLTLLRRLLHGTQYDTGWDCLSFRPYRDVLDIVTREGRIRKLLRPATLRSRNIPAYRFGATRRA